MFLPMLQNALIAVLNSLAKTGNDHSWDKGDVVVGHNMWQPEII